MKGRKLGCITAAAVADAAGMFLRRNNEAKAQT